MSERDEAKGVKRYVFDIEPCSDGWRPFEVGPPLGEWVRYEPWMDDCAAELESLRARVAELEARERLWLWNESLGLWRDAQVNDLSESLDRALCAADSDEDALRRLDEIAVTHPAPRGETEES